MTNHVRMSRSHLLYLFPKWIPLLWIWALTICRTKAGETFPDCYHFAFRKLFQQYTTYLTSSIDKWAGGGGGGGGWPGKGGGGRGRGGGQYYTVSP